MNITPQIAKLFRDAHFGGNWTDVSLKDSLTDVTWQHAITPVYGLNTIATLVYHMHYYVDVAMTVLKGEPLDGHDTFSFGHPPIHSQEDWEKMLDKTWADAESFARLLEQMPEGKLWDDFSDTKYGNYYRNMHGIIEHIYYHMGQIVLIKKILVQKGEK